MSNKVAFGESIHLSENGEYKQIYQRVLEYLSQHFSRLPKVDLYYDAKGTLRSETQDHQIITGGLVVVQIHRHDGIDAIGLLCRDTGVELDSVSASCKPELRTWYGYHD
jgi:hypothetical protein